YPQGPQRRSTLRQRLLHGVVTFSLGPGAFGTTHVHETFMPAGQGPPSPPLGEAGPYTFVAGDALTLEVREGGRVINAVVLIATGVNNDEHRGCLGMQVATSETAAAWNTFFADLVARGLDRVRLVTIDAHRGPVEAIAASDGSRGHDHLPHHDVRDGRIRALRSPSPRRRGAGVRRSRRR